jgi:hypothetical protein
LATVSLVLGVFSRISGLNINYAKSNFVALNLTPQQSSMAALLTHCTRKSLPIIYLGMPLSITRPSKELFVPLFEKEENILEGWKGKLISKRGENS